MWLFIGIRYVFHSSNNNFLSFFLKVTIKRKKSNEKVTSMNTEKTDIPKLVNKAVLLASYKNTPTTKREYIEKLHNHLLDAHKDEWARELHTYKKKKEYEAVRAKFGELRQSLHKLNRTSRNDLAEYRALKKDIRSRIEELTNKPHGITEYLTDATYSINHSPVLISKKSEKQSTKRSPKKDKQKDSALKQKIKKREGNNARPSSPFPFKTLAECKSRAASLPTFVRKNDMIHVLERLGFAKKTDKPLQDLTKDELCDLYFKSI